MRDTKQFPAQWNSVFSADMSEGPLYLGKCSPKHFVPLERHVPRAGLRHLWHSCFPACVPRHFGRQVCEST